MASRARNRRRFRSSTSRLTMQSYAIKPLSRPTRMTADVGNLAGAHRTATAAAYQKFRLAVRTQSHHLVEERRPPIAPCGRAKKKGPVLQPVESPARARTITRILEVATGRSPTSRL